ncbi:MAG: prephenate dehydrogenase [Oscillospiraceae bacterium]|nr:prephenate dehydrogenase [Oscillospiraceae bacterium]MDY4105817.1 prephenate dehydrogenase [Oscillospiraceae bacterium]
MESDFQQLTVGVVGLGLMGGSFAKAYAAAGHTVLAWNRSRDTLELAEMNGVVSGELSKDNIGTCDLVIIALYPQATIDYLKEMAPYIGQRPIVMDTCGIKRQVCEACFALAKEHGFRFVGGHPMAGTQFSGYKYSRPTMYKDASMIIVPPEFDDIDFFDHIKSLLTPCRFGRVTITTAENHDRMIAFSSQMAHVVSNAFVKSPTAREHKGYSAGSYKDMTRVAWLNETMWAELFLDNQDYLLSELDTFMDNLTKYRAALAGGDRPRLEELLREGRLIKEEVDKIDYRSR